MAIFINENYIQSISEGKIIDAIKRVLGGKISKNIDKGKTKKKMDIKFDGSDKYDSLFYNVSKDIFFPSMTSDLIYHISNNHKINIEKDYKSLLNEDDMEIIEYIEQYYNWTRDKFIKAVKNLKDSEYVNSDYYENVDDDKHYKDIIALTDANCIYCIEDDKIYLVWSDSDKIEYDKGYPLDTFLSTAKKCKADFDKVVKTYEQNINKTTEED